MKQIPIGFNTKQEENLRKQSEKLGSSIGSIVRLAVNDFFIKLERDNQ